MYVRQTRSRKLLTRSGYVGDVRKEPAAPDDLADIHGALQVGVIDLDVLADFGVALLDRREPLAHLERLGRRGSGEAPARRGRRGA